ncbi:ABC transporter permease [Streptomyces europaeiscabiei]|uniref:ABC transporter permease n=1 Tax=Streptomyces europaeiscabiei TaxID=146819 RepID=UPI0029B2E1DD|nr:ABC transporter permease [Streptomyces europaeiscabiei]MDX3670941.1 ABC transporter permease [Streptomyces europaeiscabiei]
MSTTTTETAAAPAARSGNPAPAPAVTPVRGLIRATLRVHQSALLFWGLLVVLIAGGLVWAVGPGLDAAWTQYVKSGCAPTDYCSTGSAYSRYGLAINLGSVVLTIAPALIGAWAGGALIARELESGTAKLAWTQSVAPLRWLAAKLTVPAALIVSGTVLLTLLNRLVWWREERLRHALGTRDWFGYSTFMGNGTLATAYALLALALGVLAGLLIRRSLPALAAGFVGVAVVMGTLRTWRHALWPVETLVSKASDQTWTGDLVDRGFITASGDHVSNAACADVSCDRTDVAGYYADFHPSAHFWPLQLVETGIILGITALLVAAAFQLLRRRTGGAV